MKKFFLILTILILPAGMNQYSQPLEQYSFSQGLGSYIEITGGTVLPATDDEGFAALPIGFDFTFSGNTFSTFGINSNGYIILGNENPTDIIYAQYFRNNVILPLHIDLTSDITGGTTELMYLLEGNAPNRILTIQWKNWDPKFFFYDDSTLAVNFQVKLYETVNSIEFCYGLFQNSPPKYFQAYQPVTGIKGNSESDFRLREFDWNTFSWFNSLEAFSLFSVMYCYDTTMPANGLVYTFSPPVPAAMSYVSSTVTQCSTEPVFRGDSRKEIVRIEIVTEGNSEPFSLTQLNLSTEGSTQPAADISAVQVFYTGGDSTFNTSEQFGNTVSDPNGTFAVTGSRQLNFGRNYFWVCYDIRNGAVINNSVDASCSQIVMNGAGGLRTPAVQSPAGSREIVCKEFIGSNETGLLWPFSTNLQSRKTQMLYTEAEIRSMCIECGLFEKLGFNFRGNAVKTLQNFRIKMKNTNVSELTTSFIQDNMVTVFNGSYTTSGPGWQYITLQSIFEWDGVSNVLIEICFQNSSALPSPFPEVSGTTSQGNHTTLSSGTPSSCGLSTGSAINVKPDLKILTLNVPAITSWAAQSNTLQVLNGSVNNEILKIPVVLKGCGSSPVNLTSLSFNTNGSTNPAGDISSAKVFYTGSSKVFSAAVQFGAVVNEPNGSFDITGNIQLLNDTSYFWLAYDIKPGAQHLNVVDADFTSFTAGGNVLIPLITAPAGSRPINALGAMSGIYYVGSGQDFATITQAVNNLNSRGLSSTVTFLLTDSAYSSETYPIVVSNDVPGLEGGSYLIIKPAPGVNVSITGLPPAEDNSIFKILGNNVTFDGSNLPGGSTRNLFINNIQRDTTNDGPRAINIQSANSIPVNNISIKNCMLRVKAHYNTTNGYGEVIKIGTRNSNAAYAEFNGINIHNNEISGGIYGIFANANTTPGFHSLNLTVTDNNLDVNDTNRIRVSGVFAKGFDNSVVTGNSIGNFYTWAEIHYYPDNNSCGIHINGNNTSIEKNRIFNIQSFWGYAEGVRTSGANVKIANNFITEVFSYTFETVGILVFSGGKQLIANNSVNIAGVHDPGDNSSNERCLQISNRMVHSDTIFVLNNIFSINIPGSQRSCFLVDIFDSVYTSKFKLLNNCYYFEKMAKPRFRLFHPGGAGIIDSLFERWQSRSGFDKNSFCADPKFISDADLHIDPSSLSVNGRGVYVSGISDDIDGNNRPTGQSITESPVDVGADQYTPVSFTGNNAILSGNVYKDGLYPVISKTFGSFTTVMAKVYPGVRSNFGYMNRISADYNRNIIETERNNEQSAIDIMPLNNSVSFNSLNTPWLFWEFTGFSAGIDPIVLKFHYNEEQLATISELNIRIAVFNGVTWDSAFAQTVNTDSNYIEVTFPGGYSWAANPVFSLIYNETPLPVMISGFFANVLMRDVKLRWVTEAEINNRGFYIERRIKISDNSFSNWQQLGFIEGSGTTGLPVEYSYIDRKLGKGIYQYRLRQVDLNGNYEYHFLPNEQVIGSPVKFDLGQNYPNPSNPVSKIDFTVPFTGKVSLRIYDLLGREVVTLIDKELEADYYSAEFNGSNLASGVYFYRLTAEGGAEKFAKTMKLILVK
ncbi:MAG TPA: BNR-repeat neuraminidase N-terminal domain-containing protein [Ignavibacteria bacterium]|nr:BNR-repeat neuraminidase N-terminal domain-containing protein [Ignavibacteria bacterium]HRF66093.1 BNR-repeat neuraminidase N-terminal domain-containing protein [Ignavibacteria bacterium]HRJ04822.1 BNR-repeat neuraminidase N-terminal domain-containing protein [Ignavibacteria bacterium]